MIKATQTIKVPKQEMRRMNDLLGLDTISDAGRYEVIKTYSAKFDDGYEVDIKVCNGEPPFVDPVLFQDGSEVRTIEVCDTLDGEYIFNGEDYEFTVLVEAE